MEEFPPNSKRTRQEPKKVERVTSADAVRRKKPLGRQFRETFFGGDARTASQYVFLNVLIPSAKEMIVEVGQSMIERIVYGEHRTARRRGGPPSGAMGHVNYRGISSGSRPDDRPPMPRSVSRQSRARHNFDEIVLSSRPDAEEVLDRMFDLLSQYEQASVADLYELVGLEVTHTDHKWGWTDLHGAHVERLRSGGYLLDLPDPEPLS